MAVSTLSLQDILNERRRIDFVGRQAEQDYFRKNLGLPPTDPERKFIIHISGQAGVGKTILLQRFRAMAGEKGFLTATIAEWQTDVPEALGAIADQFATGGLELEDFTRHSHHYFAKKSEVDADPTAPLGYGGILAQKIAGGKDKTFRRLVPVGTAEPIDESKWVEQNNEFDDYLERKFKNNKQDVELVASPVEVLTPLFLENFNQVAAGRSVAWFIDTFEKTGVYLSQWLRHLLEGRFGALPANVVFVVAGREPLNHDWASFEPLVHRINLAPQEAESYLWHHQITAPAVMQVVLALSDRVPLLLAALASQCPKDLAKVGAPSGDAVERFLKWVEDSKQRQAVLYSALPLVLSQSAFEMINGPDAGGTLFNWLKSLPFVKPAKEGWVYHEVIRHQLLSLAQKENPQKFRELQQKLSAHFSKEKNGAKDFGLYHEFCAEPENILTSAVNAFWDALKEKKSQAKIIATALNQAGRDTRTLEIENWGKRLGAGMEAIAKNDLPAIVNLFSALLEYKGLKESEKAVVHASRGDACRILEKYAEALEDFNRPVELNQNYDWAIASRGETYRLMENYEAALKDFNRAIELDANFQWAYALRGETHRLMGKYDTALADFNHALELNEKDQWAIASRAQTHRSMKNYAAALPDFDRAIQLSEKAGWIIIERGETHLRMGNYEAALKDFNRAIELNAQDDWALASRARAYLGLRQYQNAETDFLSALAIDAGNGWYYYSLGICQKKLGRMAESTQNLNRAIQIGSQNFKDNPNDNRAALNLALYCLAGGQKERGLSLYQQTMAKSVHAIVVEEAREDLNQLRALFPEDKDLENALALLK
jgi:tetratricopeptide (TPR) repeat protein